MFYDIKTFQRRDGSLLFCVSFNPALTKDVLKKIAKSIPLRIDAKTGITDSVIFAPCCNFQFFNISDEQLKSMEIKPESPAEPK